MVKNTLYIAYSKIAGTVAEMKCEKSNHYNTEEIFKNNVSLGVKIF